MSFSCFKTKEKEDSDFSGKQTQKRKVKEGDNKIEREEKIIIG